MWCAQSVRHSQDFSPRAQCMYKKHFHDAKSWPLCYISPAPAPSAIALLHREWLKRTHKVLNFWISRNLKSCSHIFKFWYILLNFPTNESFTIPELPRSTRSSRFQKPDRILSQIIWKRKVNSKIRTNQIIERFNFGQFCFRNHVVLEKLTNVPLFLSSAVALRVWKRDYCLQCHCSLPTPHVKCIYCSTTFLWGQ